MNRQSGVWRRLLGDERGVAMVTALMVSVAVLTFSTVAVGISVHNSDRSSLDRNRTDAIQGAEAGLNQMVAYFKTATVAQVCAPPSNITDGALSNAAGSQIASFSVTVSCDDTSSPNEVLIKSTAYSPNATAATHAVREMETAVNIHPKGNNVSSVFGHAMFHASSTTPLVLGNNLSGDSFNGADVYSNADVIVQNQVTVSGNVTTQKSFTMNNNSSVNGSVWSVGGISLAGSGFVGGNATASASGSNITLGNSSRIAGNARAGGSISPTNQVSGTSTQNSPSSPPASESLPTFTWDPTDNWPAPINTYNTANACADFTSWFTSNQSSLVGTARISGSGVGANCPFSLGNNTTDTLSGDLAIINDGDISFQNQSSWLSADGQVHQLYLISLNGNVSFGNNTNFDPALKVFIFTRNTANLANLNDFHGVVYANNLNITNHFTLYFAPVSPPGFRSGNPGFDVDTVYIREVPVGT